MQIPKVQKAVVLGVMHLRMQIWYIIIVALSYICATSRILNPSNPQLIPKSLS